MPVQRNFLLQLALDLPGANPVVVVRDVAISHRRALYPDRFQLTVALVAHRKTPAEQQHRPIRDRESTPTTTTGPCGEIGFPIHLRKHLRDPCS